MAKTKASKLRALMDEHSLTGYDIADKVNRSAGTVYTWLSKADGEHGSIPDSMLELIKLKLKE